MSGYQLPVFVSSAHYGLEDLRGELTNHLSELGVAPFVSSEAGFPDYPGMPPYAGCLRVLDRCLFVIGIIDRRYGSGFQDWGPYPEYSGLSPTHAELRHALKTGKRLVVFVRDSVYAYYDLYRDNPTPFASLKLPPGLDHETMELIAELKHASPAPWIETFKDVREVKRSVHLRLINDLYELMLQREAVSSATVEAISQAFLKSDASLRKAVLESTDQRIQAEIADLDGRLATLNSKRAEIEAARDQTEKQKVELAQEISLIRGEKLRLSQLVVGAVARVIAGAMGAGINPAALGRTASATTLPLITDQELALGGIHFSGFSQAKPVVERVTWARLPKSSAEGIWRGYTGTLQVFGTNFAPGCIIQVRKKLSNDEPTFGWTPNVYSGHYLELSTSDSDETPIGDLACEYRIKNPLYASDWKPFSYDFDVNEEMGKALDLLAQGESAMSEGRFEDATEPLRSAWVRLEGLVGPGDERYGKAHNLWEESLYSSGRWKR